MDGTIFLPTSGRKNNLFFDRNWSVGSFKIILAVFGAAVLLSILLLIVYAVGAFHPIDEALARTETIRALVHDITAERWQIERYLASGNDYAAAETAVLDAQAAIEQLAFHVDDYNDVDRLSEIGASYLNLLRSYDRVASAAETGETLPLIRAELDSTANQLDEAANALLADSLSSMRASVQPLSTQVIGLGGGILAALVVLFGVALALVMRITRHSARILGDVRHVAQQITAGNFDARINLTGEHDRDIVQLGAAFNHMADNLNRARESESAANEQNRLQLLKLARQERMTAILEERQRIARELHDSVKQQLFSITLSAGAVDNMMQDAPPFVKTHLEHIKQAGHSAQSEMTILLQELVSVPLQDQRLEDALLEYLNPLCETHGLKLIWRIDGTNTLTIAQEHALFRAVQEAVSNVIRHSGATVLRVSIRYGLLTHVIVEDNGKGFAVESIAPTSNGLSMMRTRLKDVGGRYDLQTEPGGGTRLTIQLDLRRR